MKSVIVFLLAIAVFCPADTLFVDCFDDGNADGWSEWASHPDSSEYYVLDAWYHFDVEQLDGYVASLNGDNPDSIPHQMSIPDYSVFCKLRASEETQHAGVLGRWMSPPSDQCGYIAWFRYSVDDFVLWRHDGPGNYTQIAQAYFTCELDVDYWVRFDLWGGILRVKVWEGSLGDEPGTYLVSAYDLTYTDPGSIGMIGQSWGTNHVHIATDSILVFDPFLMLEQATWGAIKSCFPE